MNFSSTDISREQIFNECGFCMQCAASLLQEVSHYTVQTRPRCQGQEGEAGEG